MTDGAIRGAMGLAGGCGSHGFGSRCKNGQVGVGAGGEGAKCRVRLGERGRS